MNRSEERSGWRCAIWFENNSDGRFPACIAGETTINNLIRNKPSLRRLFTVLGTTVALVLLAVLMISALPKGFKMTHEQIGTGKPALVFVHDPNLVVSVDQTEQMNRAREVLGEQVFFLIAKIGTPQGDRFIARHQASPAELLLFDPSGRLIDRRFPLADADQLIEWIPVDAPVN